MVLCGTILPTGATCKLVLDERGHCKIHKYRGKMKECIVKISSRNEVYEVLRQKVFFTDDQILELSASAIPMEASINLKSLFPNIKLVSKTGKSKSSGFIGGKASSSLNVPEAMRVALADNKAFVKIGFISMEDNSTLSELIFYKYIEDNIIRKGRSPNFITFLAGYYTSAPEDLGRGIWEEVVNQVPAAKDSKVVTVTVTEMSKGKTLFEEILSDLSLLDEKAFEQKYISIIFQVLYSLRELFAFGMKHNDLILSNVFVEPGQDIIYEVSPGKFYRTKGWIAKIYDYDLATFNSMKPTNTKVSNGFCLDTGVCHNYNDKFDMYLFLWDFWRASSFTMKKFTNLISKTFIMDSKWKFRKTVSLSKPEVPFRLGGRMCGKWKHEGSWFCEPLLRVPDDEIMSFTNALELTSFFDRLRISPDQVSGKTWKSIFAEK
jgi:hypothetical protein